MFLLRQLAFFMPPPPPRRAPSATDHDFSHPYIVTAWGPGLETTLKLVMSDEREFLRSRHRVLSPGRIWAERLDLLVLCRLQGN